MPRTEAESLHTALVARPTGRADAVDHLDQGTKMARHLATTDRLSAPVYFCDSHSPWRRGSNENTNGLLRDYFLKGFGLDDADRKYPDVLTEIPHL